MPQYLLAVDFQGGVFDTPMEEWHPDDVQAHLDYYAALYQEVVDAGEMVDSRLLTGPDMAKIVTSDGVRPVVTDGPFQEFKEWVAGFQIIDVETEARALEIAARLSAVPGPGGIATQQPIQVRPLMTKAPADAREMESFFDQVTNP